MKRILLIANYRQGVGGISGQVELLHKYINRTSGYRADIFSLRASFMGRLGLLFKLWKIGEDYDVFHIHACSYGGFLPAVFGVLVGKVRKKRLVASYHGGSAAQFFKKYPRFVRYFLRCSDENIVLSGYLKTVFRQYDIPCRVIPNILDFTENHFIERPVIHPRYISIRSLNPEYNVLCIIKAFELLQKDLPTAELNILGDGSCAEELKRYVEEHDIKRVEFTGRVQHAEIYTYLSQSDVFVSSPLVDNQPMSVLEAYNTGLLVISSRVGGVPYLVEDRKTGLLFESGNYEELAGWMLQAVTQQEQSKTMIRNAYSALSRYSWEAVREKMLQLY